MMEQCNSYYGSFRTRTFADIYPTSKIFRDDWNFGNVLAFYNDLSLKNETLNLDLLFYLLYAKYGNSHIAFSDENQFKVALKATIWQYAPAWSKRLDIQSKLRTLSEEEITTGGKAIYNHSYNPNSAPSTNSLEELLTINDQNTTNYKKSKLEGYGMLWELLDNDVTADFINQFKKLFITVTAPDYPLLYSTEVD